MDVDPYMDGSILWEFLLVGLKHQHLTEAKVDVNKFTNLVVGKMMENGCGEFIPGEGRDDGVGEVRWKWEIVMFIKTRCCAH